MPTYAFNLLILSQLPPSWSRRVDARAREAPGWRGAARGARAYHRHERHQHPHRAGHLRQRGSRGPRRALAAPTRYPRCGEGIARWGARRASHVETRGARQLRLCLTGGSAQSATTITQSTATPRVELECGRTRATRHVLLDRAAADFPNSMRAMRLSRRKAAADTFGFVEQPGALIMAADAHAAGHHCM